VGGGGCGLGVGVLGGGVGGGYGGGGLWTGCGGRKDRACGGGVGGMTEWGNRLCSKKRAKQLDRREGKKARKQYHKTRKHRGRTPRGELAEVQGRPEPLESRSWEKVQHRDGENPGQDHIGTKGLRGPVKKWKMETQREQWERATLKTKQKKKEGKKEGGNGRICL